MRRPVVDFYHHFDESASAGLKTVILIIKKTRIKIGFATLSRSKIGIGGISRNKIGIGSISRTKTQG